MSQQASAERVVNIRKAPSGHGQQYEIKWQGQTETTWEAASRVRRQVPALVAAFEQMQLQRQDLIQDPNDGMDENEEGAEGDAADSPADGDSMRAQMAALEQMVRAQAEQMRAQEQQLAQLRSSPQHSPQQSARETPQLSPAVGSGSLAVAAAALSLGASAAAHPPQQLLQQQQSRFAKKEPRAQDLKEYDGASGAKLEEWLQELAKVVRLFSLNGREAVEFGMARLTGAALQWSLALNASQQAALVDSGALAAALRARFQPLAVAVLAREQLDRLTQGTRSVNDYIADFQRIRAQLPDMGEADALHAFGRGLRADLLQKLREHDVATVQTAIELAARIGGLRTAATTGTSSSATNPHSRIAAAHQMEMGGDGEESLDERITRAVLNAMQTQPSSGSSVSSGSGLGARTQTQRNERGGSQRGRGRGGRFGGQQRSFGPPVVPGVPEEVVRRRLDAQQCVRCGEEGHRSPACPNSISALGK